MTYNKEIDVITVQCLGSNMMGIYELLNYPKNGIGNYISKDKNNNLYLNIVKF